MPTGDTPDFLDGLDAPATGFPSDLPDLPDDVWAGLPDLPDPPELADLTVTPAPELASPFPDPAPPAVTPPPVRAVSLAPPAAPVVAARCRSKWSNSATC